MRSSSSETRCVDFFRDCVFGALRALWFCGIWVPPTLSFSFVCFYRARLRRSLGDFSEKQFVVNLPELPSFWGTTFGGRGRETDRRTSSGGSKKRTPFGGKVSLCATGFFLRAVIAAMSSPSKRREMDVMKLWDFPLVFLRPFVLGETFNFPSLCRCW